MACILSVCIQIHHFKIQIHHFEYKIHHCKCRITTTSPSPPPCTNRSTELDPSHSPPASRRSIDEKSATHGCKKDHFDYTIPRFEYTFHQFSHLPEERQPLPRQRLQDLETLSDKRKQSIRDPSTNHFVPETPLRITLYQWGVTCVLTTGGTFGGNARSWRIRAQTCPSRAFTRADKVDNVASVASVGCAGMWGA